MTSVKYKTSLHCGGCVNLIKQYFEEIPEAGIEHWQVDLGSSDKVLTVEGENLQPEKVEQAVKDAGYEIEELHRA